MSIFKKISTLFGFKRNRCAKFAEALAQGLISRNGESDFMQFKARIVECAPNLFSAFEESNKRKCYDHLPEALTSFFSTTLDVHIVDINFPATRSAGQIFNNNFAPAQMLQSIVKLCATKEFSPKYLIQKLIEVDSANAVFLVVYSKLLLADGEYRKAADVALAANRLLPYDCCINDLLNQTQKALSANGFKPDFKVSSGDFSELFCDMPFLNMRLLPSSKKDGSFAPAMCMVASWLPVAFEHEPTWNSDDFQEVRSSILDGSFKYCSPLFCVYLRDRTLPKKAEITNPYLRRIIDNNLTELPKGPERILFNYDTTCNLCCPSCRTQLYKDDEKTVSMLDEKMDVFLAPLLPDTKQLSISLSGEALASKHSMRILKSITPEKYPDLKVELYTNMALFSRSKWSELGNSAKSIKKLFISIDGATKETLEKLRYGLKWERLLDALKFARELRINGDIENIFLSFLLQRDNYLEMPALLKMASEHCIDEIMISPLVSHGSYTQQEFQDVNICDPKNPLFEAAQKAVGELKQRHEAMLADRVNIESSGKSVPHIMWRVESMFKA